MDNSKLKTSEKGVTVRTSGGSPPPKPKALKTLLVSDSYSHQFITFYHLSFTYQVPNTSSSPFQLPTPMKYLVFCHLSFPVNSCHFLSTAFISFCCCLTTLTKITIWWRHTSSLWRNRLMSFMFCKDLLLWICRRRLLWILLIPIQTIVFAS